MHDTGCLGLAHWDNPEEWYGEGGGRRVQDGEHDSIDCSLLGSSVHGIFQARILEWVAMPFSREFSPPRDQT